MTFADDPTAYFSSEQVAAIRGCFTASGILSFFGALTMVTITIFRICARLKNSMFYQHFSNVLLLCLSFTDMITGFVFSLSYLHREFYDITRPRCLGEAIILQTTQPASVYWVSAICLSMYLLYSKRKTWFKTEKNLNLGLKMLQIIYILFCWGFPITVAIAIYPLGKYGDAGWWCGINQSDIGWVLSLFITPIIVCFVFNLVLFSLLIAQRNLENYATVISDLFWYIPGFLIVWTFPIVATVVKSAMETPIFWMELVSSICLPLQGFVNFIIWGVIKGWKEKTEVHEFPLEYGESEDTDGYTSSDMDMQGEYKIAPQPETNPFDKEEEDLALLRRNSVSSEGHESSKYSFFGKEFEVAKDSI